VKCRTSVGLWPSSGRKRRKNRDAPRGCINESKQVSIFFPFAIWFHWLMIKHSRQNFHQCVQWREICAACGSTGGPFRCTDKLPRLRPLERDAYGQGKRQEAAHNAGHRQTK
jgi:hypothetical protein